MKSKNESSFGFLDFITELANECFFANGSSTSPFDINFNNHYNKLYEVETYIDPTGSDIPEKIIVDKKSKSITADYNGISLPKDKLNDVQEFCSNNNIQCDVKRGKLQTITINKNSTGVMDDRHWKKELK